MAIITNNLRQLAIDAFVDILTNDVETKNAYFFFGKSAPWTDEQSIKGVGTVITNLTEPAKLDISNGTFSGISLNDLIKNLDNGEVRQVKAINSTTQVTLSAVPGVTWNTANWAFKKAVDGTVWVDDNNPPAPTDCVRNFGECEMTMLALKKIDQQNLDNSASRVIPRYDWDEAQGTVYAPYKDNDGDLLLHPTEQDVLDATQWNSGPGIDDPYTPGPHFVLVSSGSNLHVFKCLENGGEHNKSTVKPNKADCNVDNNFTTTSADGYKWKFMYSLSAQQVIKFLTDSWVPIKNAVDPILNPDAGDQNAEQWEVQSTTERGTIDSYTLIKVDDDIDPLFRYGDSLAGTALPDQSGVANNQIQISGGTVDDTAYLGCDVFIFSSDNNRDAQIRTIQSYVGATGIATLDSAWDYPPVLGDTCCIAPKVTVVGYQAGIGEAAVGRAVIISNKIDSIQVISTGSEYRTASAKVTVVSAGEELEVAKIKPELSPLSGHGANAVNELGGYFLMLNVRLKNEEGLQNTDGNPLDTTFDFMRINDYRTIGIVRNIEKDGDFPTDSTLKAVKTLLLDDLKNGTGFSSDELIEYRDSGNNVLARGYVIEYMSVVGDDNDTLTFFQDLSTDFDSFSPVLNGKLYGITSGEEAVISSVIDTEIDPYTGEILYIEQRKPIIRAEQQLEDIKIVIEF